ncbi:MAG: DMT family transporter [Flavisolibacter sp.]
MNNDPNISKSIISDAQNNLNVVVRYISYLNPLTIRKKGTRAKALFALATVCFLWGTTWLASKEGVSHMPALQLAGMRQFLGGMCYVVFFLVKGVIWPKGKEWWPIIILSFLNFMLSNALSTWGLKYISPGLGSIIGSIFPLWLVIISFFGPRTKLSSKTIFGLLLGFTGICVIFYEHLNDFFNAEFRFGIFLSLASTWSWAFGTLYTKKQAAHFNPYFGLGLQMVISSIVIYLIAVFSKETIPVSDIPWRSWASIGYLVMFGSVLSFIAYLYALQNLSTEQASLYAYINPIVAYLLGAIIYGDILTPFIVAGVLITLYGVYLVNRASMKERRESAIVNRVSESSEGSLTPKAQRRND